MKESNYPIYEAQIGALGHVRAWRMDGSYCFTYFNGYDYTPLFLSPDAAYYTWLFIGALHPDCHDEAPMAPLIRPKSAKCKPASKPATKKKKLVKKK